MDARFLCIYFVLPAFTMFCVVFSMCGLRAYCALTVRSLAVYCAFCVFAAYLLCVYRVFAVYLHSVAARSLRAYCEPTAFLPRVNSVVAVRVTGEEAKHPPPPRGALGISKSPSRMAQSRAKKAVSEPPRATT